jgi:Tfp pilus assembly protein PilF
VIENRNDDAEVAFKRAIELDPNLMSSYRLLAQFYARTGRTGETIGTYEKALEVKSDQPQIHHFLGVLYEFGGERDKAVKHYEEAIRYEPNLGEAKNNLACWEKGGISRALDLAQDAKGDLPDDPNAADTLGWVLYKKKVPAAAIGYLREAVSGLAPEDPNLPLVRITWRSPSRRTSSPSWRSRHSSRPSWSSIRKAPLPTRRSRSRPGPRTFAPSCGDCARRRDPGDRVQGRKAGGR